jgi:hypothetical protein
MPEPKKLYLRSVLYICPGLRLSEFLSLLKNLKCCLKLRIVICMCLKISEDTIQFIFAELFHSLGVLLCQLLHFFCRLSPSFFLVLFLSFEGFFDPRRFSNQEELSVDIVKVFWLRWNPAKRTKLFE